MTREDATLLLFEVVKSRHLDRVQVAAASADVLAALAGERSFGDRSFRFEVRLPGEFPRALPQVVVEKPPRAPPVPHVEADGTICAYEREGTSVTREHYRALIDHTVERALQTFERGLDGKTWPELFDELPQYWCFGTESRRADAFLDLAGPSRLVVLGWVRHQRSMELLFVADRQGDATSVRKYAQLRGSPKAPLQTSKIPYLRLPTEILSEPFDPLALRSADGLRAFLERCGMLDGLEALVDEARRPPRQPVLVLGFPRSDSEERTPLLLHFAYGRRGIANLHGAGTPWNLVRMDRPSLLGRAGSRRREARVGIVGCGAIGGHLATLLASSGVSHLTLIDDDRLEPANIFRHALGRVGLHTHKVFTMAEELRRRFPYLQVETSRERGQAWLGKRARRDKLDVVAVTIGDVTQSRELQEALRDFHGTTVFTWLEPLGIGGHVLTRLGSAPGCYECLFRTEDGAEDLYNRADFAAADQQFSRSITGCGGAYTPYSTLDATQTALLAARAIVDVLDGNGKPGLQSWRGNPHAFVDAGLKLSDRWARASDSPTWLVRERCPLCGGVS